jgi:uncharacterized protein (TIGR03437 family)
MRLFFGLLLAAAAASAASVSYTYDSVGRLLSATYDNGTVVTYTYDKAGNLLGRTIPGPAPQITANGVGNAATYVAPLVRGELATIVGQNLSQTTASATTLPLPTTMSGVQVTVNGILAPLYFISPGQINFQVPFEAPTTGSVPVVVKLYGGTSAAQQVAMTEYAPAIYGYARTATVIDPIVVHTATYALVSPDNPAAPGESLIIFATGAGTFDVAPPATGAAAGSQLAQTKITPTVTVAGTQAQIQFSGLAPGFIGLLQINLALPQTLPSGTQQLILAFGPAASAPANLYVK